MARLHAPFRVRRWRILPRLPQHQAEFLQLHRPSIRYYRGRKVLHSCVKIQLYLLFLEKEKNRPGRGRVLVRNVFFLQIRHSTSSFASCSCCSEPVIFWKRCSRISFMCDDLDLCRPAGRLAKPNSDQNKVLNNKRRQQR